MRSPALFARILSSAIVVCAIAVSQTPPKAKIPALFRKPVASALGPGGSLALLLIEHERKHNWGPGPLLLRFLDSPKAPPRRLRLDGLGPQKAPFGLLSRPLGGWALFTKHRIVFTDAAEQQILSTRSLPDGVEIRGGLNIGRELILFGSRNGQAACFRCTPGEETVLEFLGPSGEPNPETLRGHMQAGALDSRGAMLLVGILGSSQERHVALWRLDPRTGKTLGTLTLDSQNRYAQAPRILRLPDRALITWSSHSYYSRGSCGNGRAELALVTIGDQEKELSVLWQCSFSGSDYGEPVFAVHDPNTSFFYAAAAQGALGTRRPKGETIIAQISSDGKLMAQKRDRDQLPPRALDFVQDNAQRKPPARLRLWSESSARAIALPLTR